MRSIVLLFASATLVAPLAAQAPQSAYFVTVQDKDTVSLESYTRFGNIITGTWVAIHNGVFTHRYLITLGANGMPVRYVMDYTIEGDPVIAKNLTTFVTHYDADTVVSSVVRDSARMRQAIAHNAVPVLGKSVVGLELAFARLHAAHATSDTIIAHGPSSLTPTFQAIPVKLFGADSAIVGGGAGRVQFSPDGLLRSFDAGPARTMRVAPYDIEKLIARFTATEVPKKAAEAAALAARAEVTLPAAVFDKLIGTYALNPATSIEVMRDGATMIVQPSGGPRLQIYAESPAKFFMKLVNVTIEFEVDANGNGTALTLVQNGTRQRAVRSK